MEPDRPPLKLYLFGAPRLERDEQPVHISRRKSMATLAYLALAEQLQSREALAAMLWPEIDHSGALGNLRRTLSRLRRALSDDVVVADRQNVRLTFADRLWVDVRHFRRNMALVREHDHFPRQSCPECLQALTEAVGLYGDSFMAGFNLPDAPSFDEWQYFEAVDLRRTLSGGLQALIAWHAAQGDYEPAITYARRWLGLDALHEPAHRQLMELYAQAGQPVAALHQYEECARILEEELGVEPEEETTQLYEAIRLRRFPPEPTAFGQPAAFGHPQPVSTPAPERYHMEERISVGGQGEVWRGVDSVSGEPVMIKRLRGDLATDAEQVARFAREGQALRQLNHPNIVRMLALFEEDGRQHIVMEDVPGGSLRELLEEEGPLPVDRALAIALELADALSRAHHLGIVHRDVKPDNVLLASDGTPRLTDFGLARLQSQDSALTRSGTLLGSPAYMSPEALHGEKIDARSDVWSFGALLYEMLAGRSPFVAEQLPQVLVNILHEPIPSLAAACPQAPPALVELVARMLTPDRDRRIPTVRQVAALLEAIDEGPADLAELPELAAAAGESERRPALVAPGSEAPLFVAREQEMQRLQGHLGVMMGGERRVVFVSGEAGQGKTALIQAFARLAQELYPDLLVAGGNCNAYTGTGDPYLPFREILEMLTGEVEVHAARGALNPQRAQRLRQLLPETARALAETGPDLVNTLLPGHNLLQRAVSVATADAPWVARLREILEQGTRRPDGAGLHQGALFEQYARVLLRLAHRHPLLLLLDDLQWVDEGSANLLLHLGKRLGECSVMVIGAYRPSEVAVGRDGQRHPLQRVVNEMQRDLGPAVLDLANAERRAFVDAILDSEPNRLGPDFRDTLYRQTQGHPLFTIELLRGMQERGDVVRDEDGQWVAQPELQWQLLPARLEGAIGERIDRLDEGLRELLRIAAVEGEEFTTEVLAHVLELPARDVSLQLSRELDKKYKLVRALGVQRERDLRLTRYRFNHIMIQRYLYNGLDDVERVLLHEAVAGALRTIFADAEDRAALQLAHHLDRAQLAQEAAVYLLRAGDRARGSAAIREAADHYRAALARIATEDEPAQAALLRSLGECQWLMSDLQDAVQTFTRARELFERLGQDREAGDSLRLIGRLHWELGDRQRSLHYYHRALDVLEQCPESIELAWAVSSMCQMYMLASEYEEALTWGERAVELAERLEAPEVVMHALGSMGVAHFRLGNPARGREALEESLRLALEMGYPHDAGRARLNLGEVLEGAGDYAGSRRFLTELVSYATRAYLPLYAGSALVELTTLDWHEGRWRQALHRRTEITDWIERAQSMAYVEVIYANVMARIYNDLGRAGDALAFLDEVESRVEAMAELQTSAPFYGEKARALANLGHEAETQAATDQLLQWMGSAPGYESRCTLPLINACRWRAKRGDVAGARECLVYLQEGKARGETRDGVVAVEEARGYLTLAERELSQAAALFQDAVSGWQNLGRPYDAMRTLGGLAQALLEAGDPDPARAACSQALQIAEELAGQLEEPDRAGFLDSALVADIHGLSEAGGAAADELKGSEK